MSPEFSIKKLLSQGIGSCFEITKCFRNEEEVSSLHNPEFTMLEWYRVGGNYFDVMEDFENLFLKIIGKDKLTYQGKVYDLTKPWPRIRIPDVIRQCPDEEFYKIFFNEIEPKLREMKKPYFLYDYPISQASLSRPCKDNPNYAERFEVFLGELELGNCFSELTDAKIQKERFEMDLEERKRTGKTIYPIDEDLIKALEKGLPEVSGIAVGVDRLIMLMADKPEISDIINFPAKEIFKI
jgi:lysyl-tRNA synthetase class 2